MSKAVILTMGKARPFGAISIMGSLQSMHFGMERVLFSEMEMVVQLLL
ncbi:UNVERIFIED_CONTAM: hypothetical protein GTU68_009614 [Idotea baltica]|nr:hypothetical protein [Idotea baltica]